MPHPILVRADGESARALRDLIADRLPAGFEEAKDVDLTKGLRVDPVSIALIAAGGAVVGSLISAMAAVWVARIQEKGKGGGTGKAPVATLTISTHSDDIVVRLGPDLAAALVHANVPDDPAEILEIRLGVG